MQLIMAFPCQLAPQQQTWDKLGFGLVLVEGGLRLWYKWKSFYQKHAKFNSATIIWFGWFRKSLTFSRYLQQILWKSIEHHFIREKLSNIVWNRAPVSSWKYAIGELGQRERETCKGSIRRESLQLFKTNWVPSQTRSRPRVKCQGWGSYGQAVRETLSCKVD